LIIAVLALSAMVAASPPSGDEHGGEHEENLIAAKILIVVGTTATGALLAGATGAGTAIALFSGACAEQQCVDNPVFIVTPLAAAAGLGVGAVGGAILGVALAASVPYKVRADDEPSTHQQLPHDEFPDD
jgi:hypothetical protein